MQSFRQLWPTLFVLILRRESLVLATMAIVGLRLLLLRPAGDELLPSLAATVVCCVCLLAVGTLEICVRDFCTFFSKGAGRSFVITGTFDTGWCDATVGASMAPFLAASTLGWSVTLRIVVCPTDLDAVDPFDVAQLGSGHGALLEVQDEVVVLQESRMSDAHGLDVYWDYIMNRQSFSDLLNRHVVETKQNNAGRLFGVDLMREMRNQALFAAVQKHVVLGDIRNFNDRGPFNLLKQVAGWFHVGNCHFSTNTGNFPLDSDGGHPYTF
jgi:hypothetical protein